MYQTLRSCPICEHNEFKNFLIGKDHLVTNESFAIVTCGQCGFKFTNPRPSPEELHKYYQSDEYISHQSNATNPLDWIYKLARRYAIYQKLRWISRLDVDGKTMLDYGCGTGTFLHAAETRGWLATGIEPNDVAAKQAATETIQILPQIRSLESGQNFNIITLWHVLEHVSDLNQVLEKLKNVLSPKGCMIIAVPNCASFDAQAYGEYWAAYDLPRHLYHFTKATIAKLLQNHQLKIVNTLPLKLDAYYISLISEKYKGQSNAFFTAIKSGRRSNQYAKQNHQNYSSLIYLIRK
ncbi:MAG: class I SAM-dependent methyltransferase [Cyclobacteriaceae bacterium]